MNPIKLKILTAYYNLKWSYKQITNQNIKEYEHDLRIGVRALCD